MITSAFAPSVICGPTVTEATAKPVADALHGDRLTSPEFAAAPAASSKVAALEKQRPRSDATPGVAKTAGAEQAPWGGQRVAEGEWDDLFSAVAARLRKAASDPDHLLSRPWVVGGPTTLAAVVLECVDAMSLLREQPRS